MRVQLSSLHDGLNIWNDCSHVQVLHVVCTCELHAHTNNMFNDLCSNEPSINCVSNRIGTKVLRMCVCVRVASVRGMPEAIDYKPDDATLST